MRECVGFLFSIFVNSFYLTKSFFSQYILIYLQHHFLIIWFPNTVDCFVNILEELRTKPIVKLVYASSSSVYGKGATIPFTEKECSDRPTNV